jgi:hypothetical protein
MAPYPLRYDCEWREIVDEALTAFADEDAPEVLWGIGHRSVLLQLGQLK